MRTAIIGGVLMALTIMAVAAAEGGLASANQLLPGCRAYLSPRSTSATFSNGFNQGICAGIVGAIANMVSGDLGVTGNWRCAKVPDGVTGEQAVRVVVRYIEERPNRMHESFEALTLEAILQAWPCRK
jgi:hypothetical protein